MDILAPLGGDFNLLPSAASTATYTSPDLTNKYSAGIKVTVDITAATTSTLTITINYKDISSGKYITLLTSAAYSGTGTNSLTIYPGLTAVSNVTVTDVLPTTFQIVATKGDTSSWTYSIGYSLIA